MVDGAQGLPLTVAPGATLTRTAVVEIASPSPGVAFWTVDPRGQSS